MAAMIIIIKTIVAVLLGITLGRADAQAVQKCAPFEDRVGVSGEVLEYRPEDPAGPLMVWACWRIVPARSDPRGTEWRITSLHCRERTWAEAGPNGLSNLGARGDTIRNAADPVKAWFAADKVTRASPRCRDELAKYKRSQPGQNP